MSSITENIAQEWFEIPGFSGVYSININGVVKNNGIRPHKIGRKPSGGVLKSTINAEGYWWVPLRGHINRKKQRSYSIHRLLALVFIPNPENKPCINHLNSVRTDNRLENLEWCTFSENNSHAHKFGNQKKFVGEKHSQSVLTDKQVLEIRQQYKKQYGAGILFAKKYNISRANLSAIVNNKVWKHLL